MFGGCVWYVCTYGYIYTSGILSIVGERECARKIRSTYIYTVWTVRVTYIYRERERKSPVQITRKARSARQTTLFHTQYCRQTGMVTQPLLECLDQNSILLLRYKSKQTAKEKAILKTKYGIKDTVNPLFELPLDLMKSYKIKLNNQSSYTAVLQLKHCTLFCYYNL